MLQSILSLNRRGRLTALLFSVVPGILLVLFLAACAPDLANPPRLATATTVAGARVTNTPAPIQVPAPTPTGSPIGQSSPATDSQALPAVTLWVNKTSPQYEAALEEIIANFTARYDIRVELVTVAPDMLPDLAKTVATTATYALPDLIMLPLEYTVGWAEDGLLDPEAASAVLAELGPETFDQTALDLVKVDEQIAALPSDGWQQLVLYRSDWFAEEELPPPDSFEAMLTAAEVISDRTVLTSTVVSEVVNLTYSFNMPTESSLRPTSRTFEQMAIANGCQLIDGQGELHILDPVCQDTLEFYRFLCNTYCPPGVQTEVSTLNAYLEGRVGMIIASPAVLPAVAGLDDSYKPSCPECDAPGFLAENTGVVTKISGRSEQASAENLGQIAYLGITPTADDAALIFARYWFNEGYLEWLAVEPARKVPMRRGTPAEPTRFLDTWYQLPLVEGEEPLATFFGEETAERLVTDLVNADRWGYTQGEGALITTIYEELTMSILLQELLSGYYDSNRAAIEGYKRIVELIPDYEYYVDPEPTPEE